MSTKKANTGEGSRVHSVDLLSGLVMFLVALDIMRYFIFSGFDEPTNLDGTTAPLFFTRWITHYFAPGYLLLAGVRAYLKKKSGLNRPELSRFLAIRGIFIILLEVVVVGFLWKFQFNLFPIFLQFVWVLGASMVVLALLLWLPLRVIAGLSVLIIFGHNLLDGFSFGDGYFAHILDGIFHKEVAVCAGLCTGRDDVFYGFISYPILPWAGIMGLGYAAGSLFDLEPAKRRKLLLAAGLGASALFIVIRWINGYGNPDPWTAQDNALWTLLSFLNTEKYPPSLAYLLMTLGPLFLLLYAFEKAKGGISNFIQVFGRVPLFFYIMQFLLAHVLALILGVAQGYPVEEFLQPLWRFPKEFGVTLVWVYVAVLAELALMYPLCEWYADLRAGKKSRLLEYL